MRITDPDDKDFVFDPFNPDHVRRFNESQKVFAAMLPAAPTQENEVMFYLPESDFVQRR